MRGKETGPISKTTSSSDAKVPHSKHQKVHCSQEQEKKKKQGTAHWASVEEKLASNLFAYAQELGDYDYSVQVASTNL